MHAQALVRQQLRNAAPHHPGANHANLLAQRKKVTE
jgi:hypothetical protein